MFGKYLFYYVNFLFNDSKKFDFFNNVSIFLKCV